VPTKHMVKIVKPRSSLLIGLIGSTCVHLGFFFALSVYFSRSSLGIEFTLPSQVEFGLAESIKVDNIPLSRPSAASASNTPTVQKSDFAKKKDAEKPKRKPKIASEKTAPLRDGGVPGALQNQAVGTLTQYAPAGAQIALRIDMERIRKSPIADDVRSLLGAVPDWCLVLDGSGIDPIDQLDRIFIASPNLKRSSLVVAGQYAGQAEVARNAVASLASAAGKDAPWQSEGTVEYAPWLNQDETERVLALVGPQQFVIAKRADLSRVLAVAAALSQRARKNKKKPSAETSGLLEMEDGEAWSLSVEGARSFVPRGEERVPVRVIVSARELPQERVEVRAIGHFDSPEQAAKALTFWNAVRRRYASDPIFLVMGMSTLLTEAIAEVKEQRIEARLELSVQQVRVLLGLAKTALTPPPTGSAAGAASPPPP
jgi:hypothetical protein